MTDHIMDMIDAYAEARHRCGCAAYNAQTAEARRRVTDYIESIGAGGVQSLRAPGFVALGDVLRKLDDTLGPGNVGTTALSRHFSTGISADRASAAINSGASSGARALSAAPAEADMFWDAEDGERFGHDIDDIISDFGPGDRVKIDCAKRMPSIEVLVIEDGDDFTYQVISPTPPAEQQATKETSGGFHVWRDISTAPKDGSRFVAIGYNYGLYSEGRHICVAQWFRGCWMETSDWNAASELKHLTHWLPLPSPPDNAAELNDLDVSVSPQQAAPKAAPGEPSYSEKWDAELGRTAMRFVDRAGDVHPGIDDAETICAEFHKAMSEVIERMPHVQRMAAPQPAPAELERLRERIARMGLDVDRAMRGHVNKQSPLGTQRLAAIAALVKPAPAPLSRDQIREVFMAHGFTVKEGQTDLKQYVYDAAYALLGTKPAPLSAREIELLDGMIDAQLNHAQRCDSIPNRPMAEKQKGWDMERVTLLRKLKTAMSGQQP